MTIDKELLRNGSGYVDPTAYAALTHLVKKEETSKERRERRRRQRKRNENRRTRRTKKKNGAMDKNSIRENEER